MIIVSRADRSTTCVPRAWTSRWTVIVHISAERSGIGTDSKSSCGPSVAVGWRTAIPPARCRSHASSSGFDEREVPATPASPTAAARDGGGMAKAGRVSMSSLASFIAAEWDLDEPSYPARAACHHDDRSASRRLLEVVGVQHDRRRRPAGQIGTSSVMTFRVKASSAPNGFGTPATAEPRPRSGRDNLDQDAEQEHEDQCRDDRRGIEQMTKSSSNAPRPVAEITSSARTVPLIARPKRADGRGDVRHRVGHDDDRKTCQPSAPYTRATSAIVRGASRRRDSRSPA